MGNSGGISYTPIKTPCFSSVDTDEGHMKGAENTNTFPLLHAAATAALVLVLTCTGVASGSTEISPRESRSSTERVLQCRFTDLAGREWDVKNARFYRNGTNIVNLMPEYEEDRERGIITFEMTQELEGKYTCDNESVSLSSNHQLVVGECHLCIIAGMIDGHATLESIAISHSEE